MATYTGKVNLTPYWEYKPNTVLGIICYKISGSTYDISIEGPGIDSPLKIEFGSNYSIKLDTIVIPDGKYSNGDTLEYTVIINTNSNTLDGQVQNNVIMGKKKNGDAVSYQGLVFTNDAGSDNDWNDCVVNLSLFNNSSDR